MMTHTNENAMATQKSESRGRFICINALTMPPCHPNSIVTPANTATMPVYIKSAEAHPRRSAKLKVMCWDTDKIMMMPRTERNASTWNLSNRENKSEKLLESAKRYGKSPNEYANSSH